MYVQVNHADRSERNRKFRGARSHSERDEPAQRVLGLRHRPEGALQLFAGQRREIAGIDPVVGLGPGVDLGRLVLEAEPRHQGERLEEGGDGVSLERSGGLGGVQAADRARDRDPGLKRMEPGQVRDRDDPAALQVDAAVVTEREAAAEPRGRREVGGRPRQPADEVGLVRRPPLDLDQRADDLEAARPRRGSRRPRPRGPDGCGRGSRGSRGTRAPIPTRESRQTRFRASTSALSAPKPQRARATLTSPATSAKYASTSGPPGSA